MNWVDPHIVETWAKGWSLAREVSLPVKEKDGWRVDVGWPQQRVRYVFPHLSNTFQQLAETISEPWHFLKVCAPPEAVETLLPARWRIQPLRFMMTCFKPMSSTKAGLPKGYRLELEKNIPVPIAKVISEDGEIAAIGRVALVNDFIIYDRIETHPAHRHRGLGSTIMKALETIGFEQGGTKGVLVATPDGKALYESLGWQLYTLYTTAVIPEEANGTDGYSKTQ
ncbi:GNAT family N-acetyltransferase [Flavisolibacter tropicus]|uniref:N-acetyltransferase domain-containing protein n=1 Tax=Flavisolibacter tropicus TaxID=1492898 RepID=A0A172TY37_9BACT|nr:GNAT family N-acetyltransferase [Flavisolibacter tropicus]ANE52009.1 hypothetical protein SY85_17410 [Flavisolibacter tropicus]